MRFCLSNRRKNRICAIVSAAHLLAIAAWAGQPANLYQAEMQEIKTNYLAEKKTHDDERLKILKELLAEGKTRYQTMFDQQKLSGNITGMAVARTGITTFEGFSEQLEKTGDFTFPVTARRELQEHLSQIKTRKAELDEARKKAVDALDEKYLKLFTDRARAQGADVSDAAAAKQLFLDLLGTQTPVATPGPDGATPAGTASNAAPVIQGSGAADKWFTFARWYATVRTIEILQASVANVGESASFKGTSAMGSEYEVKYEAIREIEPVPGALFQALPIRGKEMAEILEWPSPANKWTVSMRVRPAARIPSEHGIELQVSYPGVETVAAIGDARAGPSGESGAVAVVKKVKVKFITRPEGAHVYVDGARTEEQGKPVTTPCTVGVPEGRHEIKLRLLGSLDATIVNFVPEEGREYSHAFRNDPRFVERTFQVSARSGWRNSGVEVAPGDVLIVEAAGQWSCGNKGELVGPDGYPNDQQFFHYYIQPKLAPRDYTKFNYGALLLRIGTTDQVIAVPKNIRAGIRSSGAVQFGINEAESARGDNTGALTVTIRKGPAPD